MMEELNERINTKTPALVFRAIEPSFTWETVVGYLQHCVDNEVGEPIGMLSFRLPMAEQLDSIRPVFEYLNENLDIEVLGSDLYATMTTKNEDIKYKSKNDVLIWNVLGESFFKVNDESRDVQKGDLIYVPAETEYVYKPQQARAYVVFSLSKES